MQTNDLRDTEILIQDMMVYFFGHNRSLTQLVEQDILNIQLKGDPYTLINIQTVPVSLWQDDFVSTIYVVQLDMFFHLEGAFKRGDCYHVYRIYEVYPEKVTITQYVRK